MGDPGKSDPTRKRTSKRSLQDKPEAADLLPILKDLNLLHASAEKKGHEFLSYLLHMAILETQSLASRGGAAMERSPPGNAEPSGDSS